MTTQRPAYERLEDLLDDLAAGRPWHVERHDKHIDSLSGSVFELATVGEERLLVKHISRDVDWIMRNLGDGEAGRRPWALVLWQEGLLDALPPEIDHLIVGMVYDGSTGHLRQVMRYEPQALVPAGHDLVPLHQHRRFLDHMAALHATFWGFEDRYGLITPRHRYGFADPRFAGREASSGRADRIPQMFQPGWDSARAAAPAAVDAALEIVDDSTRLERAMADGPSTLVHGDWKFGNLGSRPDGRTVLLDWGWPGAAGPCVDLGWYVAVNCDRLPESKEDTIAAYRVALEHRGVDTTTWWDRQLGLALLGAFAQLGWSKSGDELGWWAERVTATAHSLEEGST
jgi:hypothetical protein